MRIILCKPDITTALEEKLLGSTNLFILNHISRQDTEIFQSGPMDQQTDTAISKDTRTGHIWELSGVF